MYELATKKKREEEEAARRIAEKEPLKALDLDSDDDYRFVDKNDKDNEDMHFLQDRMVGDTDARDKKAVVEYLENFIQ